VPDTAHFYSDTEASITNRIEFCTDAKELRIDNPTGRRVFVSVAQVWFSTVIVPSINEREAAEQELADFLGRGVENLFDYP